MWKPSLVHIQHFIAKKPVLLSRAKIGIMVFRDLKFLNVSYSSAILRCVSNYQGQLSYRFYQLECRP